MHRHVQRVHHHARHVARRVHLHITQHALGWGIFLMVSGIIGIQVSYPFDRALPFARFAGESVGLQSYEALAASVNTHFIDARATLAVSKTATKSFTLRDSGAQPEVERTIARLTEYPVWQRLIPLSIFFQWPNVGEIDVTMAPVQRAEFAVLAARELTTPPRDATLSIKDGQLVMTDDTPGTTVAASDVVAALSRSRYGVDATAIPVYSTVVPPTRPRAYFEQVKAQAEKFISSPLTITLGDTSYTPDRAQKASWLTVGETATHTAELQLTGTGYDTFIKKITDETSTAATTTSVTRVDGRETARQAGAPGKMLDASQLREQITTAMRDGGSSTLTAQFIAVAPPVIINQKYSSSEDGLRAYVTDQSNTKNVRIYVQQLDGGRWTAGARENESTPSASTYKLFVALMLFDKMDRGEITWETPILDTDTRGCFERMIVASTNPCAEEWIRQFGSSKLNAFLYSKGFSNGTTFTDPEATHTTAADLARYFRGLHEGWLMSGWARQYLLDALKRHHYTKGIPSGSAGDAHNKVGFLWDYSNDSAVVYHPRGTYVIAVMTKGLSFYAIADITREIEAIMYP